VIRIFRVLVPASALTLLLSDLILLFLSYFAVWYYQSDGDLFLFSVSGWQPILMVELLLVSGNYFRHLYRDLRVHSRILLLQQLCLVFGVTFIAEALISYWGLDWAMPRNILVPGSALALAVVYINRILYSLAIRNRIGTRRVLFVGFSPTVARLAKRLRDYPELGLTPIGFLGHADATPEASQPETTLARLGPVAKLPAIVDEHHPDWIVVGTREEIEPEWVDDFLDLRFGGAHTERVGSLYEATLGRVCMPEVRPGDLVFSERLQPDRFSMNLQPFYSIAISLVVSAIALPFLAILAILVKVTSRGPILMGETRIGMNGVPFMMYRFRSTTESGEVTRIGRFLRQFGLDALPQFWNVFRGEMSIVGPSPDRPEFAERLNETIPFHPQRTTVKPGMTGWAQIHYFGDGEGYDAMRRLEYDLYYVKNLSPSLDFSVMLRWVREVTRGFNAA
jgi:lipopolysaccharide/colanic/teichoic acid biosynthesis glycosyltransferase